MAVSEVSICNMAIGWLAGTLITSLESDQSVEAQLCRANYEPSRDATLEARDWTFAFDYFPSLAEAEEPKVKYSHSHIIDPSVLRVIEAREDEDFGEPNTLRWERSGNRILADQEMIYYSAITKIKDVTRYSPLFVKAFAANIAMEISIPLTRSRTMHETMQGKFEKYLALASASDGRQGRTQKVRSTRLTRVRM